MTDRERQREYLLRWKTLGPVLQAIRDSEIRDADTAAAIEQFRDAFRIALRDLPARQSSGLVEWHRRLANGRPRG